MRDQPKAALSGARVPLPMLSLRRCRSRPCLLFVVFHSPRPLVLVFSGFPPSTGRWFRVRRSLSFVAVLTSRLPGAYFREEGPGCPRICLLGRDRRPRGAHGGLQLGFGGDFGHLLQGYYELFG